MQNFKVPRERPKLLSPITDEFASFDQGKVKVEDKEKLAIKRLKKMLAQVRFTLFRNFNVLRILLDAHNGI